MGLTEHWPYVKLATAIFVLGILVGVLLVDRIDLFALLGFDELDEVIPEELTTFTILLNNSIVFLLAVVGVLSFGALTAIILLFNGLLVGYVATPVAAELGFGFLIVGLAPHGVLELPAFFVAGAVAFRLLHRFLLRIRDRRERILDPGEGRRIALVLGVSWLALALAAVIEVHLTVWLLETFYPEVSTAG